MRIALALVDTADLVDKMNAKYSPIYSKGVIPAKTYPGQDKDNAVAVVQNILVANANMPDDVAYNIVKTLMEKKPEDRYQTPTDLIQALGRTDQASQSNI